MRPIRSWSCLPPTLSKLRERAEPARMRHAECDSRLRLGRRRRGGVLFWLGLAGPGFWGYGTSLLWAGPSKGEQQAFYDIAVQPGNRTVRRKSDQLMTARTVGFTAQHARAVRQIRERLEVGRSGHAPAAGWPEP